MDLVGHLAGPLLQLADDQRVYVLIGGAFIEGGGARVHADLLEGIHNLRPLFRRQDADALQGAREGLRAADIALDQPAIEVQGVAEALEHLARSAFKPPAPELHFPLPPSAARTLMGSPMRLMKPSASF